jgi:hypothetical protein
VTLVGTILQNIIALALALICGVLLLLYAFVIDSNLRDAAFTALIYSLHFTTNDFLANGETQNIFLLVAYLFRSIFISIIFAPLIIAILIGEAVSARSYVWYAGISGFLSSLAPWIIRAANKSSFDQNTDPIELKVSLLFFLIGAVTGLTYWFFAQIGANKDNDNVKAH